MLNEKGAHVFVDEYGDAEIDVSKDGVSQYFVLTALFVDDCHLQDCQDQAEAIRRKYFQSGEMKSSKIAKNDTRRIAVLRAINKLPISHFSIGIDKRRLDPTSGLRFRPSFFKNLSRRLYTRIFSARDDVWVVADRFGRETFMASFASYLNSQLPPDLFIRRGAEFRSSADVPLLQVADVISGSLGRVLDPERPTEARTEILEEVKERSTGIDIWPPTQRLANLQRAESDGESDRVLAEHAVRLATIQLSLLEKDATSDPMVRARIEFIQCLFYFANFVDEARFVPTRAIIGYIKEAAGISLSEKQIRSDVVARLRDAGMLIASGRRGYKIPFTLEDIGSFSSHVASVVLPLLHRMHLCRKSILDLTGGEIDVLGSDGMETLRSIVLALGDAPVLSDNDRGAVED